MWTPAAFLRLAAPLAALVLAFSAAVSEPAEAQSRFEDFGVGAPPTPQPEPEPDRDRPPDLRAYGEIAETYRASSALDATTRRVEQFRTRLAATVARAPMILSDIRAALARAAPGGDPTWFAGLFAFLAFLLGIGRAAGLIFAVYVARPIFVRLQKPNPQGLADKLPVLAARVGFVLVGVGIAILVAALVGAGFYPEDEPAAVVTAVVVFGVFGAFRVVDTLWRMILAPFLPAYRVPVMTDREATRLYRWLYFITLFGLTANATLLWLDQLGLQPQTSTLLHIAVTAVEIAFVLAAGWTNRCAVDRAILGGRPPAERTWLARASATLWGPAIIVFMAFAWFAMVRRMVLETGETQAPDRKSVV